MNKSYHLSGSRHNKNYNYRKLCVLQKVISISSYISVDGNVTDGSSVCLSTRTCNQRWSSTA